MKVDASRGRNDPRKPGKTRRAWRGLAVSPAEGYTFERQSSGEVFIPYEQNALPADVG